MHSFVGSNRACRIYSPSNAWQVLIHVKLYQWNGFLPVVSSLLEGGVNNLRRDYVGQILLEKVGMCADRIHLRRTALFHYRVVAS